MQEYHFYGWQQAEEKHQRYLLLCRRLREECGGEG